MSVTMRRRNTFAASSCSMYALAMRRCLSSAQNTADRYWRADVGPLLVELRGIVRDGEEDLQQLAVRDARRVVDDPDRFGVTCPARADDLVLRRSGRAAGVPGRRADHAFDMLKDGLHAPEAPARHDHRLGAGGVGQRFIERGVGNGRLTDAQPRRPAARQTRRPASRRRRRRRHGQSGCSQVAEAYHASEW